MALKLMARYGPNDTLITEEILVCPACEAWQLHYPLDLVFAAQWGSWDDYEAVVEQTLREHVGRECPYPQVILAMTKDPTLKQGLGL